MEKSERMFIFITAEFEAFHQWPDAPLAVEFLKYKHRHVFKVKVHLSVKHDDRQLEFFTLKDSLSMFLQNRFGRTTSTRSCEMFAKEIHEKWGLNNKYPIISIEVSEDGENGAVYFPPVDVKQVPPALVISLASEGSSTANAVLQDSLGKAIVRIRKDGRCDCEFNVTCPIGKKLGQGRCSEGELHAAGKATIRMFDGVVEETIPTAKTHPIHVEVRDYCFIGFEAEGKYRKEVVLFVPASYPAKKLGKILTKLTKTRMELPTRIYIGAGNDWIRDGKVDIDNIEDLIQEAGTFADDRNEEADDFGLDKVIRGIDLEIESVDDCPVPDAITFWGDPDDRKIFRVISRKQQDLPSMQVDAIKLIRSDGEIVVTDLNAGGVAITSVETKTNDPLFESDVRINKEFFQLAEEFSKRRPPAMTGRALFSFAEFVPFVRLHKPYLLCCPKGTIAPDKSA